MTNYSGDENPDSSSSSPAQYSGTKDDFLLDCRRVLMTHPDGVPYNDFPAVFRQLIGHHLPLSFFDFFNLNDLIISNTDIFTAEKGPNASILLKCVPDDSIFEDQDTVDSNPEENGEIPDNFSGESDPPYINLNDPSSDENSFHFDTPEEPVMSEQDILHSAIKVVVGQDQKELPFYDIFVKLEAPEQELEVWTVLIHYEDIFDIEYKRGVAEETFIRLKIANLESKCEREKLALNVERPTFEVRVSQLNQPHEFYVVLLANDQATGDMMTKLREFYTPIMCDLLKLHAEDVQQGLLCCAPFQTFGPHRVKILDFNRETGLVDAYYIDYGTYEQITFNQISYLLECFTEFPAQAFACTLYNAKPAGGAQEWNIEKANRYLGRHLCEREITIEVVGVDNDQQQSLIVCVHLSRGRTLLREYVKRGFAEPVADDPNCVLLWAGGADLDTSFSSSSCPTPPSLVEQKFQALATSSRESLHPTPPPSQPEPEPVADLLDLTFVSPAKQETPRASGRSSVEDSWVTQLEEELTAWSGDGSSEDREKKPAAPKNKPADQVSQASASSSHFSPPALLPSSAEVRETTSNFEATATAAPQASSSHFSPPALQPSSAEVRETTSNFEATTTAAPQASSSHFSPLAMPEIAPAHADESDYVSMIRSGLQSGQVTVAAAEQGQAMLQSQWEELSEKYKRERPRGMQEFMSAMSELSQLDKQIKGIRQVIQQHVQETTAASSPVPIVRSPSVAQVMPYQQQGPRPVGHIVLNPAQLQNMQQLYQMYGSQGPMLAMPICMPTAQSNTWPGEDTQQDQ